MRQAFTFFGYALASIGAFLVLAAFMPSEEGTSAEVAKEETISCLIIGIPAMLSGGGLVWSNQSKKSASINEIRDGNS